MTTMIGTIREFQAVLRGPKNRRNARREPYRGWHLEVTRGGQHELYCFSWRVTGLRGNVCEGGNARTIDEARAKARARIDELIGCARRAQAAWAEGQAEGVNCEN